MRYVDMLSWQGTSVGSRIFISVSLEESDIALLMSGGSIPIKSDIDGSGEMKVVVVVRGVKDTLEETPATPYLQCDMEFDEIQEKLESNIRPRVMLIVFGEVVIVCWLLEEPERGEARKFVLSVVKAALTLAHERRRPGDDEDRDVTQSEFTDALVGYKSEFWTSD